MSTRKVLIGIALVLCFVAGQFTASIQPLARWWGGDASGGSAEGTARGATAEVERSRTLRVMGRLMPRDGIVGVGANPGDRLIRLNVKLDDWVEPTDSLEPDDHLGVLESYDLRSLELEAAESRLMQAERKRSADLEAAQAQLAAAEEAVAQAEAGDPQIEYQAQQAALAKQNLTLAESDLVRLSDLPPNLVSTPELERQQLAVEQARLELVSAEAALQRTKQGAAFQLRTAKAQLEVARTALAQADSLTLLEPLRAEAAVARHRAREGLLIAPSTGRVIAILTRPGQMVGREPILQIADTINMACIAEVHESDIHRVRIGQRAEISSPALQGATVAGVVSAIGLQAGSPQLRSLDPLAPSNRHAIEVRIELDAESSRIVSDLTDLQVNVAIQVGG